MRRRAERLSLRRRVIEGLLFSSLTLGLCAIRVKLNYDYSFSGSDGYSFLLLKQLLLFATGLTAFIAAASLPKGQILIGAAAAICTVSALALTGIRFENTRGELLQTTGVETHGKFDTCWYPRLKTNSRYCRATFTVAGKTWQTRSTRVDEYASVDAKVVYSRTNPAVAIATHNNKLQRTRDAAFEW